MFGAGSSAGVPRYSYIAELGGLTEPVAVVLVCREELSDLSSIGDHHFDLPTIARWAGANLHESLSRNCRREAGVQAFPWNDRAGTGSKFVMQSRSATRD